MKFFLPPVGDFSRQQKRPGRLAEPTRWTVFLAASPPTIRRADIFLSNPHVPGGLPSSPSGVRPARAQANDRQQNRHRPAEVDKGHRRADRKASSVKKIY